MVFGVYLIRVFCTFFSIKQKTSKRSLKSSNVAGKSEALNKKSKMEPGTQATREAIDNSSDMVDGDCDDFVSSAKRPKRSSHIVESFDDDDVIFLD